MVPIPQSSDHLNQGVITTSCSNGGKVEVAAIELPREGNSMVAATSIVTNFRSKCKSKDSIVIYYRILGKRLQLLAYHLLPKYCIYKYIHA